MEFVESWPWRLGEHGLCVSTGPVVLFRAKPFLLNSLDGSHTVPLLSVHNIRPFETLWLVVRLNKPAGFKVRDESLHRGLLVPNGNYVLLRRFSAKKERRRLTASRLLKGSIPQPCVALENHVNSVYHAERRLSEDEVFGSAGLFNSRLLDRYFRRVSGNTQVNAADLRRMRFPELATISRIGKRIRQHPLGEELGAQKKIPDPFLGAKRR